MYMKKEINWDLLKINHGDRAIPSQGKPKYSNIKELFSKALENEKAQESRMEFLQKAQPLFETLLKSRMESGTELKVLRPLVYQTSVLTGSEFNSKFINTQMVVNPGTSLILKSIDPTIQEFIFKDQNGNEIALPFSSKQNLITSTNIYEDVVNFLNSKGD